MLRICALFVLVLCASPAAADFIGKVHVIDGDTIDVGDTRVRLHGIDAVELAQTCTDADGADWDCGKWVRAEVVKRVQGKLATCQPVDQDRYGRVVAKCFVNGQDIAEGLVSEGLVGAYAKYSSDYLAAEKGAAVAGRGLWSSTSMLPSEFRLTRVKGRVAPDANCTIKGNISKSGRIYHMPHNRDYARTGINLSKGEQWFCSEHDAQAAGWRPAFN
ncbi:thermonuclease family protein [Algirhabdus cladophorae]|uniref:thermonuclease family protein n=1 Tax=Algirhabdus cladophorae TaxID=3377108 RepID=UPI003B8498AB